MKFLSNSDISSFLLGGGPKVVSKVPMVRKQGNGNFTGFVRSTYDDGSTSDFEFIVNARTKADVVATFAVL